MKPLCTILFLSLFSRLLLGAPSELQILVRAEEEANQRLSGWIRSGYQPTVEIKPVVNAPEPAKRLPFSIFLTYRERGAIKWADLGIMELFDLVRQFRGQTEGIIDHIVTEAFYGTNGIAKELERHPHMIGSHRSRHRASFLRQLRLEDVLSGSGHTNEKIYESVINWLNQRSGQRNKITVMSVESGKQAVEIDAGEWGVMKLEVTLSANDEESIFEAFVLALQSYVEFSPYRCQMLGLENTQWLLPRNRDRNVRVEFRELLSDKLNPTLRILPTGKLVIENEKTLLLSESGEVPIFVLDSLFSDGHWYRLSDFSEAFLFIRDDSASQWLSTNISAIEVWEFPYDPDSRRLLQKFPYSHRKHVITPQIVKSCGSALGLGQK